MDKSDPASGSTSIYARPSGDRCYLRNWGLRLKFVSGQVGRLDAWMNNSGYGQFEAHPMVEQARTIGMTATGRGCIAVASHVSKDSWTADLGAMQDTRVVTGRTSPFSSLGPTRDGREKPDISAPGQYLTAALADQSELSLWDERAQVGARLRPSKEQAWLRPW